MIKRRFSCLGIAAALAGASFAGHAQQLITGVTGAQCAAYGGSIRTWTNTAGTFPQVGECYVPPRMPGRGGGSVGGGGNNTAAQLGAAAGVLSGLAGFLGTLAEMEEARKERERQWLQELQAQREFNREHTAATERELMAREAALRARERARSGENALPDTQARASAPNPFAAPPDPGSNNKIDADLAKCREGSSAPWTIAGCYDLKGGKRHATAEPDSLRERLRRSLGDSNSGSDDGSPRDERASDPPRAAAPAAATPAEAKPQTLASNEQPQTPWRTRDERACRESGGVLVAPSAANDLTGIPEILLERSDVPRALLAATPYCNPVPNMSPAENAAEVRRMMGR